MIRSWQINGIVVMAAVAAWLVWTHPPGSRSVQVTAQPTPSQEASVDGPIRLLFVGDIMLSRSVGDRMLEADDWTLPFAHIASVTSGADLTFGNLESVISDRGMVGGCGYCFRADPRVIAGLTVAGFDVLSVANNHAWDYGTEALDDTLQYLAVNDISVVGGGRNADETYAPVVRMVSDTRIAFLAFTDLLGSWASATDTRSGIAVYDEATARRLIERARTAADVVVVSFHGGEEYELQQSMRQEDVYRSLIDAGADLVVGHHPHVVQPLERYSEGLPAGRQGWIAYSLGNFIFDQSFSEETMRGMMLEVDVDGGRIVGVASVSVGISTEYQAFLR